MSVMSVRLNDTLNNDLKNLSESTGRTKSWLASQAIKRFIEDEQWQIEEIKKSLVEAENSDFATVEQTAIILSKLGITLNEN